MAWDWASYDANGQTFLIFGIHHTQFPITYDINSILYTFNPATSEITQVQNLPTVGNVDWQTFSVGGTTYALAANQYNTGNYTQNSRLYRVNVSTGQLESLQNIVTNGATDWEAFEFGGTTYALVANQRDGSSPYYNADSVLYTFNPGTEQLTAAQYIPTAGANDWKTFEAGGKLYALLAQYCGNGQNYCGGYYELSSKLYRMDGGNLTEIQSFPTFGAIDWETFEYGGTTYALLANQRSNTSTTVMSKLFRFNTGTEQLDSVQDIETTMATDWEIFTMDGTIYALLLEWSTDASIYKFNPATETLEAYGDSIPAGYSAQHALIFPSGGHTYAAFAVYSNTLPSPIIPPDP